MPRKQDAVTPVERAYRQARRRRWLVALLAVAAAASWIFWGVIVEVPVDYRDDDEHFYYGSIGSDSEGGIPYHIWAILPEMFPHHLPDPERFATLDESRRRGLEGYRQFGFLVERGRTTPIGFSVRRDLVDRVGMNCAICHTSTIESEGMATQRLYAGGKPRTMTVEGADGKPLSKVVVPGMPAQTVDLQAYFQFLFDCVSDPHFTTPEVMAFVERRAKLGPIESLIYRRAVPQLRSQLLLRKEQLGYFVEMAEQGAAFGPGRVDTFGPYKSMVFGFPYDGQIGTADFPSLWQQDKRVGMKLHWDGNNQSVFERNISASLGAGATPVSLDMPRMLRVARWTGAPPPEDAPPGTPGLGEWRRPSSQVAVPRYPFEIDELKAARGELHYRRHCASCHAFGSDGVGEVVPIDEIGTDRHRWESYTYELSRNQNTLGIGQWWRFRHFRRTEGYANQPLDGVWARAPYLHNGSVPTLRHLLSAEEERPAVFFRGDDRYDPVNVGFQSHLDAADAAEPPRAADGRRLFRFDTSKPGNGNGGHLYGVGRLDRHQTDELLEYLKTL